MVILTNKMMSFMQMYKSVFFFLKPLSRGFINQSKEDQHCRHQACLEE